MAGWLHRHSTTAQRFSLQQQQGDAYIGGTAQQPIGRGHTQWERERVHTHIKPLEGPYVCVCVGRREGMTLSNEKANGRPTKKKKKIYKIYEKNYINQSKEWAIDDWIFYKFTIFCRIFKK